MPEIKPGDLLISPANMPDSRFDKTVLLLTHDHNNGSFALCLNRPTDYTVTDIAREVEPELQLDIPLYWGGPVSPNTVWMLHDSQWSNDYTIPVNDRWSITSHASMFTQLAEGDRPQRFRIMHGFASWSPDQLKHELAGDPPWDPKHSWLVAHDPDHLWLLEVPEEDLWTSAISLCSNQAVAQWMA